MNDDQIITLVAVFMAIALTVAFVVMLYEYI